jgi:hypothetical protein
MPDTATALLDELLQVLGGQCLTTTLLNNDPTYRSLLRNFRLCHIWRRGRA